MKRFQFIATVDRASVPVGDRGFYAPQALGRSRRLTPEGYLICEAVPIARTGMQLYQASELAGASMLADDRGVIRVERPPQEVFRPDTIASFEGKALTVEHPPEFVGPHNRKKFEVGHCQNVRRGTGSESDLLIADLVVKDPAAIKHVNQFLPEVSSGYDAGYEQTAPGYARQVGIIGNHVALVRRGRAGPRVAIRDSINSGMSMKTHDSILGAVHNGKLISLGTVWEGGLRARVDGLSEGLKGLVTQPATPNETPDLVIDLGEVSDGITALENAIARAAKRKAQMADDSENRKPLTLSHLTSCMNRDSATAYGREPQAPARMPTSIADMNRQSREFPWNRAAKGE